MSSQPASSILPEEELARSGVYALLGALLTAPCSEALRDFITSINDEDGNPHSTLSWKNLKDEVSNANLTEAAQDYHDLFIGLGRGELLPYGSVYLSGFLQEKPLAELRIDLGRLGFEAREDTHEPEDHAGALCEVMSIIVGAPNEFSYDTQSNFLRSTWGRG